MKFKRDDQLTRDEVLGRVVSLEKFERTITKISDFYVKVTKLTRDEVLNGVFEVEI